MPSWETRTSRHGQYTKCHLNTTNACDWHLLTISLLPATNLLPVDSPAYPDNFHRNLKSPLQCTTHLNAGPSSDNCQSEVTPQRNAYEGRSLPAIYCDVASLSHSACNEDNSVVYSIVTLRKAACDITIVQYTGWRLYCAILKAEISAEISVDNRNHIHGRLNSLTFLRVIYTTMFTMEKAMKAQKGSRCIALLFP